MFKREPSLDDLLNDPLVRKVMEADGYSAEDIKFVMTQAGGRHWESNPSPTPRVIRMFARSCRR